MAEAYQGIDYRRHEMAKAISVHSIAETTGTGYPPPYDAPVKARSYRRLAQAFGITQFGVNIVRLPPGVWSSQRHWHALEDEFVHILEGEVVMLSNDGEQLCHAGDVAGFKAGTKDGHHFINRSNTDALLLIVGSRLDGDHGEYPDIDMKFRPRSYSAPADVRSVYTHKDNSPFDW
jgi:uncharacterized cupin superfamily protein